MPENFLDHLALVPFDEAHDVYLPAALTAEQESEVFIERLRAAREEYEWKVVGRRANMVDGLTTCWNHVRDDALKLIT